MTLKDLAEITGFSVSVVSRALSARPDKHTKMSEKTRSIIREAAEKHGFRSNLTASCVRKKKRPAITIFQHRSGGSATADLMNGFAQQSTAAGLPLMFNFVDCYTNVMDYVSNAHEFQQNIGCIIRHMHSWQGDPEKLSESLHRYCHGGGKLLLVGESLYHPVVRSLRDLDKDCFSTVSYDNAAGGRIAAEYLIRKNCRECFTFSPINNLWLKDRFESFSSTLQSAGIRVTDLGEKRSIETSFPFLLERMNKGRTASPVGVFDSSSVINHFNVFSAHHGIFAGKDYFPVQYNYDNTLVMSTCPFTPSIAQDYYTMGRMAISMIVRLLKGKKVEPVVFTPELIEKPLEGYYLTQEYGRDLIQ